MNRALCWVVLALSMVTHGGGCGAKNPLGRNAISGTVTLDGIPIEEGTVDFQPLNSGGVGSGALIINGKYSIEENQGLPVGKYLVRIHGTTANQDALPPGALPGDNVPVTPRRELVPPEWNAKSKQTIEVTEQGPYEFNFTIAVKKK